MISDNEKLIMEKLLNYKKAYGMLTGDAFTNIPEAEQLIKQDWNAFLFAVIFDQQIKAERAWAIPLELKKRLGHLDADRIAGMSDEQLTNVFKEPPALHRWINKMPVWIKSACKKLKNEYRGKAENIWQDSKDAKTIIERFDDFDGISQKKSTMAVNFLVDYFKIPLTNWDKIDISVDIMIRRVFKRVGLVPDDAPDEEIIKKAQLLMPSFPGDLDYATWDIGRYWCLPQNPYCYYKENGIEDNCPLVKECQSVKLLYKKEP